MNIHIVDSVKGGAGKSTFAVKLGCHFALKDKENEKNKENRVKACIIDLDILGTSWEYNFINYRRQEGCYLNDLIVDYRDFSPKVFFCRYEIKYGNDGFLELEVLPCNPSPRAKAMFRTDGQNMPEVSYDFFEDEMIRLIDKLERAGYTDIILDMPPNTEPYSERILESCLQVNKILYKNHRILLYMVSSLTPAHIGSTLQWYEDWIETKNTRFVTPEESVRLFQKDYKQHKDDKKAFLSPENVKKKESASFCFVLNNMHNSIMKAKSGYISIAEVVDTALDKMNIKTLSNNENVKKRLVFCLLRFDEALNNSLNIFERNESFDIQNNDFRFFGYGDDSIELQLP